MTIQRTLETSLPFRNPSRTQNSCLSLVVFLSLSIAALCAFLGRAEAGYRLSTLTDQYGITHKAYSINNHGQVVGSGASVIDTNTTPYTSTLNPDLLGAGVIGINDNGQMVGTHNNSSIGCAKISCGFLYSGGTWTNLDFPAASWTEAVGINNSSQVVVTVHQAMQN